MTISRSDEWDCVAKLKNLIDRWGRGVAAVNQGKIHPDVALARFAKLTDEIAECIAGYEHIREVEFLLAQWFDADWETSKNDAGVLRTDNKTV
jgi:hypothetical protein